MEDIMGDLFFLTACIWLVALLLLCGLFNVMPLWAWALFVGSLVVCLVAAEQYLPIERLSNLWLLVAVIISLIVGIATNTDLDDDLSVVPLFAIVWADCFIFIWGSFVLNKFFHDTWHVAPWNINHVEGALIMPGHVLPLLMVLAGAIISQKRNS
jgi:hypothetical protein